MQVLEIERLSSVMSRPEMIYAPRAVFPQFKHSERLEVTRKAGEIV